MILERDMGRSSGCPTPCALCSGRPKGPAGRAESSVSTISSAATDPYAQANVIYLLYALGMLMVDFIAWPRVPELPSSPSASDRGDRYASALGLVNGLYASLAALHVLNAVQYLYMWLCHEGGPPSSLHCLSPLMDLSLSHGPLPDWLNLIGALLYSAAVVLYPWQDEAHFNDWATRTVRCIELLAAVFEFLAAVLWAFQWTTSRKTALRVLCGGALDGRRDSNEGHAAGTFQSVETAATAGWHLACDGDLWATAFTLLPSAVYLHFAVRTFADPSILGTDRSYEVADVGYALGAVAFLVSSLAMREHGKRIEAGPTSDSDRLMTCTTQHESPSESEEGVMGIESAWDGGWKADHVSPLVIASVDGLGLGEYDSVPILPCLDVSNSPTWTQDKTASLTARDWG